MNTETTEHPEHAKAAATDLGAEPQRASQVLRLTRETTLFIVDYHIWSGRKKLRPEDLKMGSALPPDALISLGSKKVCDPDALRVFHRHKKHIERLLLAVGTRFLGGYLVPNSAAAAIQAKAAAIVAQTRAAAQAFLAAYDRHIDAWCAAYPDWETAIRNAVDPLEVVRGQFRFRVQALQIETAPAIGEDTLQDDLAEVGETLFTEVEQLARGLEQSFLGKETLSQRAVGPFRRIYDKLNALSFVDDRIDPVVRSLRHWLGRLPTQGPIAGGLFLEGWALMRLVSDAQAMARHGAGLLALAELMPAASHEQDDSVAAVMPAPDDAALTEFADLFDEEPLCADDATTALSERDGADAPGRQAPGTAAQTLTAQDFWF
jgi:hypothetical protein